MSRPEIIRFSDVNGLAVFFVDARLRDNLKAIEKYVTNSLIVQADTIGGLAEKLAVFPAAGPVFYVGKLPAFFC